MATVQNVTFNFCIDNNADNALRNIAEDNVDEISKYFAITRKEATENIATITIHRTHSEDLKLNGLHISAFYGSDKCFNFFMLNKCKIDIDIGEFAIQGGITQLFILVEH